VIKKISPIASLAGISRTFPKFGLMSSKSSPSGDPFENAATGNVDAVRFALQQNPGLVKRIHESSGMTLLHLAARYNHVHVAQVILEVDPTTANITVGSPPRSPAQIASFWGNDALALEIMKFTRSDLNPGKTFSEKPTLSNSRVGIAPLLFSAGSYLNRNQHIRKDEKALCQIWNSGNVAIVAFYGDQVLFEHSNDENKSLLFPIKGFTCNELHVLLKDQQKTSLTLQLASPDWNALAVPLVSEGVLVYLGQDASISPNAANPISYFGLDLTRVATILGASEMKFPQSITLTTMRSALGPMLKAHPIASQVIAVSRSLLLWHARNPRCALCGDPTYALEAGWHRKCRNAACATSNGSISGPIAIEYPRTDPAVMVCVASPKGGAILLGRSHSWPRGMYSLIAGFVEPGESAEGAAAREVQEETNIEVDTSSVQYVASQPWPFPGSLMLGFFGRALNSKIVLNDKVLEHIIQDHARKIFIEINKQCSFKNQTGT
jgi:NADH pyrophosphatase NudC (nudix superfamily)